MNAVATLLAQSRTAWPILKLPSGIQPKMTAAMEARKPTTVAWTWKQEGRDELGHLFWPSLLKFKVFRPVHVKFTLFSFIISVHMTLLGFWVISKKRSPNHYIIVHSSVQSGKAKPHIICDSVSLLILHTNLTNRQIYSVSSEITHFPQYSLHTECHLVKRKYAFQICQIIRLSLYVWTKPLWTE